MTKPKYTRHFAVVTPNGEILFSCRTRKQGEKLVATLTPQVIETTKTLPPDAGKRYLTAGEKPYHIKDFK